MKMKMSCMRGVCWRSARTSSGKKSPARNQNEDEEIRPRIIAECGKQFLCVSEDNWVNIRTTMGTGAAGHVMPAEMFPGVKLDRTTTIKKLVAAHGEKIEDLVERTIPFKSVEGVHRCIKFRSANVVKPLISMRKVV